MQNRKNASHAHSAIFVILLVHQTCIPNRSGNLDVLNHLHIYDWFSIHSQDTRRREDNDKSCRGLRFDRCHNQYNGRYLSQGKHYRIDDKWRNNRYPYSFGNWCSCLEWVELFCKSSIPWWLWFLDPSDDYSRCLHYDNDDNRTI